MPIRVFSAMILSLVLLTGCSKPRVPNPFSNIPAIGRKTAANLPADQTVPGLQRISKVGIYRGKKMVNYMGQAASLYLNHGAEALSVADYALGGKDRTLTLEAYTMDSDMSAAGLFHYFRGRKLRDRGSPVDVGAEGVLDKDRENRNLYFYAGHGFTKLIYTGPKPVPDLVPLAVKMAGKVTRGKVARRPKGYDYLQVEGVDHSTARVTGGHAFNYAFLPPGIFARAPGAGPIADVFLLGHVKEKDAEKTARNYRTYLELNGLDYSMKYTRHRRIVWWGRAPDVGRVVCTRYKNFVIGVQTPKDYTQGEVILDRVVQKMGGQ